MVATAWQIGLKKRAKKDAEKIRQAGLSGKVDSMLDELERDPFYKPPPFEKLMADLDGLISRRITLQHRLVYGVDEETRQIVVYSMFRHYDD